MYGSIPGNAVVVNFLMRFPALIPVAAVTGIAVAVPPPVVPVPVKTECVVLFDTDKSVIAPDQLIALKDCVKRVDLKSVTSVTVSGYTDSVWTAEHNVGLSHRRALAVKQAIVEMGGVVDKIMTGHYGKTAQFGDNETDQGRQQNRRATVTFQ